MIKIKSSRQPRQKNITFWAGLIGVTNDFPSKVMKAKGNGIAFL
jgi:hypothetical protein